MATGTRKRIDFQRGDLGAALTTTDLTITFAAVPDGFPALAAGEYIPIILTEGTSREIVHMTTYTAGEVTGTIERAQEASLATAFTTSAKWHHGPTRKDVVDIQGPAGPAGPEGPAGPAGLTGPKGDKGDPGVVDYTNSMFVVNHGTTGTTARPTGVGAVYWIGSVTPTNAVDGDLWNDTA